MQAKSLEKLSSGLRINRAGDDAAGLAISEKMRGQISGLNQASRNAQDGISLIQTAEGALAETHSMLQRMRELTVQANNGTNTAADRGNIQEEIGQLQTEITGITDRTEFNGTNLLDGNFGASASSVGATLDGVFEIELNGASAATDWTVVAENVTDTVTISSATLGVSEQITASDVDGMTVGDTLRFDGVGINLTAKVADVTVAALNTFTVDSGNVEFQIGANANQSMSMTIGDMDAAALGVDDSVIDVTDFATTDFDTQIAAIDDAIDTVSSQRSELGAKQNRLEHTISNLTAAAENLTAAESRVRDVDMAKEMMEFTKNNILSQASTAMLAQANQMPQSVLQLLR